MFKVAKLVYKFLSSGYSSYLRPFLTPCSSKYNTKARKTKEKVHGSSSLHKLKRQFGHGFAFDAPTIWNELPTDVHSASSITSLRKKLKSYLFFKVFLQ